MGGLDGNAEEVTEWFAVKWSFLLRRCPELVEATSLWGLARSEEALFRAV